MSFFKPEDFTGPNGNHKDVWHQHAADCANDKRDAEIERLIKRDVLARMLVDGEKDNACLRDEINTLKSHIAALEGDKVARTVLVEQLEVKIKYLIKMIDQETFDVDKLFEENTRLREALERIMEISE